MGLDSQRSIIGDLIVYTRTVHVLGTYGVQVRNCQLGCTVYSTACVIRYYVLWYRYTLVCRALRHDVHEGNGNSSVADSDVAVEGARRGSQIRPVSGGDLHRHGWMYGFVGAGRELVLHACDCV